jgi:hypothetical protein
MYQNKREADCQPGKFVKAVFSSYSQYHQYENKGEYCLCHKSHTHLSLGKTVGTRERCNGTGILCQKPKDG